MKKASYFSALENKTVRCELCPHHCVLTDRKRGICLTRQNIHGELVSLNYCRPVSSHIDPIEKKPLFHFYPGSQIYSCGPNGCTFRCLFCQNCDIAQSIVPTTEFSADSMANAVIESKTVGIAYTYSEPYIWFETIMDVGAIVKEHGLKNVLVTNGFMEPAPLADLLTVVDAMNIDIKSIRPDFYRRLCKAELEPVLRTCEEAKKKCHIEITNLVIPGENDTEDDFRDLVDFINVNLGKDTPLHFSRYFPRNKATYPPTKESVLFRAWEIAKEKLDHVYVGNIEAQDKANTYCPSCKALLIKRSGYSITLAEGLKAALEKKTAPCPSCGADTKILM
jgi:pyruvate formate lyase activating enzyme